MSNKLRSAVINRAFAALMLLVLTCTQFIAIFHHHSSETHLTKEKVFLNHSSIRTLEKSCKICDLLSDSYSQGYLLPAESTFIVSSFKQTIYFPSFPSTTDAEILGFSNKGPPLV
ncbi:hypothetical protein [Pedobacter sp. MR22-3]|uniref:hypothetical protein n=1 Tax=Pedobacter sp. MR22-3 TaxID=2994552 RepID=UPI0022475391|nr:hypothetical protein [Pedobacter sp. MR22-3]MCX2584365.1 hypothetical protein [Pedobacter sp. MR22-3]